MDIDWTRLTEFKAIFDSVEFISFVIFVIAILAFAWAVLTGRRKKGESLSNLATFAIGQLLEKLGVGLIFVVALFLFEPFALASLPMTWWSWLGALLLVDFCYYWLHRWNHEIRFLWAFHNVHHSSPEFNLTTNIRLSWFSGLVDWVFFVPPVLLGFDVVQVIASIVIVNLYQAWIHTESIGKLGWLDRVFNTPSTHRVHHGRNREYIDKNYGGILILWDRLFGTYEPRWRR